jgi:2-amino-4-hydroxy-6-hydroxymethyldihydropteridine diphosphokinase
MNDAPYEHHAVIALGSNLGNRLQNLQAAVDSLADTPGLVVTAVSPVYQTAPLLEPGAAPQEDYFNAVMVVKTALPSDMLLMRTQAVEDALGRTRVARWAARTIDIDIVRYDDLISDNADLTLPHPRSSVRAFVLAPWLDVEPEAELPGVGVAKDLLAAIGGPAAQGAARRDDLALQLP